jgi:ubiquinone/menaquinone biosynthesis C-methylase UbiE
MERIVDDEWLDTGSGTPQERDLALRSVSRINRRFGGVRLHARMLRRALARVPSGRQPHILEVGSGHAEVLARALLRLGIAPQVALLDRMAVHLPDPSTWPPNLPPPAHFVGDALDLPFPDAGVDIVSCCLLAHHLEPPQILRFLSEALRVARIAVLINDLERGAVHYRLAQLNRLIDPSPISRHDGPVSVRRAYTFHELHTMLTHTGHRFSRERAYLFRLGAVVWSASAIRQDLSSRV